MKESSGPESIARALHDLTGETVFLTLGERGMCVDDGEGATMVPGYEVPGETDIVGAGDSATAGIVPALCAGASAQEAAVFGNLAASITVQQIGTTGTASPRQMQEHFTEYRSSLA
jgi:sugar/nucleoside kinase (ribokinase family)